MFLWSGRNFPYRQIVFCVSQRWASFLKTELINNDFKPFERTFFKNRFFTKQTVLLNKQIYWTRNFTKRTIFLNEQIIFQWENDLNRWQMNNKFENEREKSRKRPSLKTPLKYCTIDCTVCTLCTWNVPV